MNSANTHVRSQFKEKTLQGALAKKKISAFLPAEQVN
jgi:hypothetical protein